MHTVLFALVLGYGYIHNSHVRVDSGAGEALVPAQGVARIPGTSVFLIPYTCIVIYFATVYAYDSYMMNEISASAVGLEQRWIIKTVLVVGLVFALVAGVAVWLQTVSVLWGNPGHRYPLMTMEWPEFAGQTIEGKRRLVLDEEGNVVVDPTADPDDLELPPDAAAPSRGADREPDPSDPGGASIGERGARGESVHPMRRRHQPVHLKDLDWYKYVRRYFWDDETTPYLIPVERLHRRQAELRDPRLRHLRLPPLRRGDAPHDEWPGGLCRLVRGVPLRLRRGLHLLGPRRHPAPSRRVRECPRPRRRTRVQPLVRHLSGPRNLGSGPAHRVLPRVAPLLDETDAHREALRRNAPPPPRT